MYRGIAAALTACTVQCAFRFGPWEYDYPDNYFYPTPPSSDYSEPSGFDYFEPKKEWYDVDENKSAAAIEKHFRNQVAGENFDNLEVSER